ncbi:MAG: GAF domain-containing protein [Syntrophomonadaceae bacterium]
MNAATSGMGIAGRSDTAVASFFKQVWNESEYQICLARMIFNEDGTPRDYVLVDINPAARKTWGAERVESAGRGSHIFSPYHDRQWIERCAEAVRTGGAMVFDEYCTLQGGREQWHAAQIFPLGEENLFLVVSREITRSKAAEQRARLEDSITAGINRMLHDALFCHDEEELGMTCLNVALELTGSRMGFINELNTRGSLDCVAISGMDWESGRWPDGDGRRLPRNLIVYGIRSRVLQEGRAIICNDPGSHPDRVDLPDCHPVVTAFIGVPLFENKRVMGMMVLGNNPAGYNDIDLYILEKLAPAMVQVLMRKRAEIAMRDNEACKSYLVELDDALRPLVDPVEIQLTACRVMGEHIQADQVLYGDVIDEKQIVIRRGIIDGISMIMDPVSVAGFDDYPGKVYKAGKFLIINDVSCHPGLSEENKRRFESMGAAAHISRGLIKEGRWIATLGVNSSSPRVWTQAELDLVEETIQRTSAAVARARAEETVRNARDLLEVQVKERTRELAQERQRLFDVLDTLPACIFLLTADYQFRFTNRAHREKHGVPDGRCCYDFVFGLDKPCESCQTLRPLETGQPHHYLFEAPDGRIIDVSNYPFTDVDGTPMVLEVNSDITDEIRMDAEMARLDRLNLVGEMAASIGHEIRNPMTAVRGFLQMLRGDCKYADDQVYFDIMIEELDRANDIISEFLGMARDKMVDLQARRLDQVVNSLHPMIKSEANLREIIVRLDLNQPPEALFDENEVRQIILNMSRNAMEAMRSGGTMTIGTRQEGDEAVLFIRDEGSGLPPQVIEKLGTPFITTKADGTGLGLAVCYSIAARHKARIDYETGPTGTTFCVSFPVAG